MKPIRTQQAVAPLRIEAIEAEVLDILSSLLEISPDELDLTMRFEDLAVDSADFVEMQLMLLEAHDADFDLAEFADEISCIGDIVRVVHEILVAAGE